MARYALTAALIKATHAVKFTATPRDHRMSMKPESVAFLRELGMPEEYLADLALGAQCVVDSTSLTSWLRQAWRAGRYSARDPYVWHSVAELMGEPGA